MNTLKNKTALVTGSTSGIGLEIAKKLAENGANVVLNGFGDKLEIEKIIEEIKSKYKVKALYAPYDVSSTEQVEKLINDSVSITGTLDILINNAGIQYVAPIQEFPIEKWESIISINLSSAFKTIKFAMPYLLKNDWGRIINIASAHGLVASPYKSAYVAAKHGILGLTKTIALEVAETNVTCNAVCPGYVKTPLVEKQIAEQAKSYNIPENQVVKDILLKAQPNKRFIEAEDLAELVYFLCTNSAKGMTGEIISMDGGWTAH